MTVAAYSRHRFLFCQRRLASTCEWTGLVKVSVSLFPDKDAIAPETDFAVVIDVLRATSVMATALEQGASSIVTCSEIEQAREVGAAFDDRPLLCGERGCKPIDGFDLGNSPAEYGSDVVADKTLVLTTTNGTRAIAAADAVPNLITSSFLNFTSTIDRLCGAKAVHLVCAGTNGVITAEDALLAGALTNRLAGDHRATLGNDEATIARQLWLSWFGSDAMPSTSDLAGKLRETQGGRNLVDVGYAADLDRCASIDACKVVPWRVESSPVRFVAK